MVMDPNCGYFTAEKAPVDVTKALRDLLIR
jgi:hypothetical protein